MGFLYEKLNNYWFATYGCYCVVLGTKFSSIVWAKVTLDFVSYFLTDAGEGFHFSDSLRKMSDNDPFKHFLADLSSVRIFSKTLVFQK